MAAARLKVSKILSCLSLLLLFNSASAVGRCYYPNTDEAVDDFPCDPDAEISPCCGGGPGAMCLSNKSCKGPRQNMIRGSCTDQSWGSLDCPLYCYLTPNIGPDLISCGNVTRRDTSFCCDGTVDCCDTGNGRFELLPSNPEAWATWDNTKSQFLVVKPLSPASAVTTSSLSTSTTAATATQTSTSTVDTATTPSAPPPAQTAPGATSSSGQAHLSGLSTAAQAGIGVGISVSAILLGLIAYLLWKLYRNKVQGQNSKQQHNPWQSSSQPEMHPYPKELPVEERRVELDGLPKHREPTELPGSDHHYH